MKNPKFYTSIKEESNQKYRCPISRFYSCTKIYRLWFVDVEKFLTATGSSTTIPAKVEAYYRHNQKVSFHFRAIFNTL